MSMNKRDFLKASAPLPWLATSGFAASIAGRAQAQSFPSKTLRFVVPYPAGGATDATARLIGEKLAKAMGQSVIVENKVGASGAIGCAEVARSPADGHTLLYSLNDPLINNTVLVKNLPYDPQKDFRFVAQILRSPALFSVNSSIGIKSYDEFLKWSQANKKGLTYGSWGIGSLGHLAGETLAQHLKIEAVHVPQRGEAPVIQDLLANTVIGGFTSAGTAKQHVLAGKIVPLAMMGRTRSSALPNVPTFKELGISDPFFDRSVWMSFLVPAKTPDAIVQRLSNEIQAIANSAEVLGVIKDRGLEPMINGPVQALADYNEEFPVITKRLRDLGIEPS
jgi:tripartite-type tricarboxylate transporter receptor subunit TctC